MRNCVPERRKQGNIAMAGRDMLTKNQLRVLERLEAASGPLSAYTLLDQLREHGFRAPLQVYRALDTLMKWASCTGWKASTPSSPAPSRTTTATSMTAFAICDKCGQVTEISDEGRRAARPMGRLDRLRRQEGGHRVPRHLREVRRRIAAYHRAVDQANQISNAAPAAPTGSRRAISFARADRYEERLAAIPPAARSLRERSSLTAT